jgi:hypothetical protein
MRGPGEVGCNNAVDGFQTHPAVESHLRRSHRDLVGRITADLPQRLVERGRPMIRGVRKKGPVPDLRLCNDFAWGPLRAWLSGPQGIGGWLGRRPSRSARKSHRRGRHFGGGRRRRRRSAARRRRCRRGWVVEGNVQLPQRPVEGLNGSIPPSLLRQPCRACPARLRVRRGRRPVALLLGPTLKLGAAEAGASLGLGFGSGAEGSPSAASAGGTALAESAGAITGAVVVVAAPRSPPEVPET